MLQVYLGHTGSSELGSSVSRLSALWQCKQLVLLASKKAVMSRDKDTMHRIIVRVEIWIHFVLFDGMSR